MEGPWGYRKSGLWAGNRCSGILLAEHFPEARISALGRTLRYSVKGLIGFKASEANASERLREHKRAELPRGVKKTEGTHELGRVKHYEFIYIVTSGSNMI